MAEIVQHTGSLRRRLKEATAREILRAAEIVLAEQGTAATSMQAIAQRAGVAVGTLYNHYKDKDELVQTLLQVRRRELFTAIDEAVVAASATGFRAQLEHFLGAVFAQFDRQRHFLRIALESERALPGKTPGETRPALQQMIDRLRPLISQGLKEGTLRPEASELYPAILAGVIRAALVEKVAGDQPFGDAATLVADVFLNGAARP